VKPKNNILAALLAGCLLLTGCSLSMDTGYYSEAQSLKSKINTASVLADAELYKRAQVELKKGEVHFYSFSSVTEQVAKNFIQQYPAFKGKLHYHYLGDEDIYPQVIKDAESGKNGIDLFITHSDLMMSLREKKLIYSYFPLSYADKVDEEFQIPAAFSVFNTIFIYNNSKGKLALDNVWELTEAKWQGKIFMKNPLDENVTFNFLVMLTDPHWIKQLEMAYEARYSRKWQPVKYERIAYEWIDGFIRNCDFSINNNTKLAKALADSNDTIIGVTGYNKLRKLEPKKLEKLNVLAYEQNIKGFAGYAYEAYATIAHNTDCPYASALFINYLLSEQGFAGKKSWNSYPGYYSTNNTIKKGNVYGDRDLKFWKDKLVIENPDYIKDNYEQVSEFILQCLKKKTLAAGKNR